MSEKISLLRILISIILTLLVTNIASFSSERGQDQTKQPTQNVQKAVENRVTNPEEKKKIYDQIKKDIEKMPLKEFRRYIDDNPIIRSDYPYSSVFALESAINKWGDKLDAVPYYYARLATEYSMISRWEDSKLMFIKQYKSVYKAPSDSKKLLNFNNDALIYALKEILASMTPGCEKYTYSESQNFLEKNPDATSEQIKDARRIIDVYERIRKEKAELERNQKIVMQLGQEFLNKEAEYVNKKDKDGLYKFLLDNCTSETRAKSYTESNVEYFFTYDEVIFLVIDAAPCFYDNWCITFRWWTKPKHVLQGSNPYVQTFFTVKFVDGRILLEQ